jgi:hypothetical protein
VKQHIVSVVQTIPSYVSKIIVVDDACPEQSGLHVEANCTDPRVEVIYREKNGGVGAATKSGYQRGLKLGANIFIKIDGDGQMDPKEIKQLIKPIELGIATYCKGNRFVSLEYIRQMPRVRMFGNIALSFISKVSSGYWSIRDPNNGFTAIHRKLLENLNLDEIDNRYFFESDMLFNLYIEKAVVKDVPMKAQYNNEQSNLSVFKSTFEFSYKHLRNFSKRIKHQMLQDFSLASLQLISGVILFISGMIIGLTNWIFGIANSQETNAGTVGLVAILLILGLNSVYLFFETDVRSEPKL